MSQEQISFLQDIEPVELSQFEIMCNVLGVDRGPGWPDQFGQAFGKWFKESGQDPIRTLSLFSGAGGLDIGFQDSGFDIATHIEIENKYAATLKTNANANGTYSGSNILCIDIKDFHPPKNYHVDFIIGGPPCQSFSAAGRRAAGVQGTSDERGTLFEEYIRLLKTLAPKGFLFENVYGITGAENGDAWLRIREAFGEAGYKIFYRILDAGDFGVPQHRERLFIVGVKNGEYLFPRPTHGPDSVGTEPFYTSSQAIKGVFVTGGEKNSEVGGRYGHLLNDIPPGLNFSFYTEKMGHPNPVFAWRSKFSDFLYKADPDKPVRTIKAFGGQFTGPFHWENRPFGLNEFKRLQTFPDKYSIEGNRLTVIQQIGNSVPPQLARILAVSILSQVFKIKIPLELSLLLNSELLGFRKRKRQITKIYQEKAKRAIEAMSKESAQVSEISKDYRAELTKGFKWKQSKAKNSYSVKIATDNPLLRISVTKDKMKPHFSIFIKPTLGEQWTLPFETVVLEGGKLDAGVYTGVWKAFERVLIEGNIKADLVQLCNYYQYQPAFRAEMILKDDMELSRDWAVLKKIVSGVGVRSIYSKQDLSSMWEVEFDEVLRTAIFLKHLGYEVRNSNTNPQIPIDNFLVPYAFPTLTPQSVQLRKSLESYDG